MNRYNLNINDIPWSRIVHWIGRATNYPKYLELLKNGSSEEQEKSLKEIQMTIEHQDGIIFATPVALPFLLELLEENNQNKHGILQIIKSIILAVNFQYEYFEIDNSLEKISLKELISEKYLWEPFESEDRDEELWEEYPYEPQHWLVLTAEILLENQVVIEKIETDKIKTQELMKTIIEEMAKLRMRTV